MVSIHTAVEPTTYRRPAIALHWLMALGLVGAFGLGIYMADLPLTPTKLKLYSWHKWAGVTLFVLAWVRLTVRWMNPPPSLPESMPAWQARVAELTHGALYGLMLLIPLSGWLMSSAKGFQTVWFGVLPLPDLLGKSESVGDALLLLHQTLNASLAVLVLAHAGAALKHHFIDRDSILRRMVPFLSPR